VSPCQSLLYSILYIKTSSIWRGTSKVCIMRPAVEDNRDADGILASFGRSCFTVSINNSALVAIGMYMWSPCTTDTLSRCLPRASQNGSSSGFFDRSLFFLKSDKCSVLSEFSNKSVRLSSTSASYSFPAAVLSDVKCVHVSQNSRLSTWCCVFLVEGLSRARVENSGKSCLTAVIASIFPSALVLLSGLFHTKKTFHM